MASIRKRLQKWEVRVRRSGFKTVCKSFIKKADAEAWARQVEIHFDRGEAPFDVCLRPSRPVFALMISRGFTGAGLLAKPALGFAKGR